MTFGIVSAAYIAAAVLFILSLGGLSGQESAKRAVWYGIAGMALAVIATVFGPGVGNWFIIACDDAVRLYHRLLRGKPACR
jgi:NAD(P) transhydrogenase subunit beta